MLRSALTVALVALLAAWIARAERHGAARTSLARTAEAAPPRTEWVRTADGWQPRGVLAVESPPATPMHPGLLAGFQLAFSLLVLIAFPGRAKPAGARVEASIAPRVAAPKPVAAPARKRRQRISRAVSA